MRRLPPLPAVPRPFPPPFRALLREILSRGPRLLSARVERAPVRRAALGQSGTFAGHRRYVRGDDLRRIDWAAYARTGDLFVMQLEEEERRTATILLDLSPRLCVGAPPRRLAALRLAAVVGGLALRHLDGLTVLAPGSSGEQVAAFAGAAEIDRLLRHLTDLPFAESTASSAMALLLQHQAFGRVHWISDFVDPGECERALAALRRRGGRAIGWLPGIADDFEPQCRGYLHVADPDTGELLVVTVDAALRAAMKQQLEVLRRRQERVFARSGCALVRWSAPAADDYRWSSYEEVVRQCRS